MSSKPKNKTYIVHHRGRNSSGICTILGSYKVGARNEKEAEKFVRGIIGKHAKVTVYTECKELIEYKAVIKNY